MTTYKFIIRLRERNKNWVYLRWNNHGNNREKKIMSKNSTWDTASNSVF